MVLNHGFLKMETQHSAMLKKIKSLLPRRESERRTHPLARHSDILVAIETRIGMLRMTFAKYIEKNACCFIPGKVIDEIFRVLKLVTITTTPPRTHEILQELRDISSMAMEHFDEEIAPNLKNYLFTPPIPKIAGSCLKKVSLRDLCVTHAFRNDFKIMQQQNIAQKKQISCLNDIVNKLCKKLKKQSNIMIIQTHKIREQSVKIKQQNNSIAELKKHVEEWDTKFQDLVQNLNRSRDDSSSSPINDDDTNKSATATITTVGAASSTPIIYKPNIKPRKAQILSCRSLSSIELPTSSLYDVEQRKRKLALSSSTSSVPSKLSRFQFLSNEDDDDDDVKVTTDTNEIKNDTSLLKLPAFLTSGIETLLKSPVTSIRSRKRKLQ